MADYDSQNIFAKILRGEIPCNKIAENDNALAFYDIAPQAAVHVLVIPKGAYVSFADFSQNASAEEMADWLRLCGEVAAQLGVAASGYRIISNAGADAKQEVPHLHMHILGGESLGGLFGGGR